MVELFICGAAHDVISECFGPLSRSNIFTNAAVKPILPSSVFIWPETGLIQQHLNSTLNECCLTRLYAGTEKVDRTGVPPPSVDCPRTQLKSFKLRVFEKAANVKKVKIKTITAKVPITENIKIESVQ